MNRTQIEWVKSPDGSQGYTWNPITGCLNHDMHGNCHGGGFPCYAYKLAHGRLKQRYLANDNIANPIKIGTQDDIEEEAMAKLLDPFYPRFWPERLNLDSYNLAKPKGVFVCDMGELFGGWIPQEWEERIFDIINEHPQHRFYLLTKQPQNLPAWSPFPENCWVGVTATSWVFAHKAMYWLGKVKAPVKFISAEPLLGPFSDPGQEKVMDEWGEQSITAWEVIDDLDWIIIGAQTKPTVWPNRQWVNEIIEAADENKVPVFLKDNLWRLAMDKPLMIERWLAPDDTLGYNTRLRQEIPQM